MSVNHELDPIDAKIIELLKEDSRMSYRHIAEIIGKTEATVRRRVNRLIESHFIRKFTLVLDEKSMGSMTKVIVKVKPDIKKIKEISDQLAEIDEITDVWRLSGDCGIIIRVEIPTVQHLDLLIENKISHIEGLEVIDTCFITNEVKNRF